MKDIRGIIRERSQAASHFREYLMKDFSQYLRKDREDDNIDPTALIRIIREYGTDHGAGVRDAQRRLIEGIQSLDAPDTMKIVDILSDITFDLRKSSAHEEVDLQLLQYCDSTEQVFEELDATDATVVDAAAIAQRIESIGVRYNDVTDRYSRKLARLIRGRGNDKERVLSTIEKATHVVQDQVMQYEHLDMEGNNYVGPDDREDIQNYREEINNIGMYVLNMNVGRHELPTIIQKVRERGDAYNTYTQSISQRIVDQLHEVLTRSDYSDREIQVAAVGVLMGSTGGM